MKTPEQKKGRIYGLHVFIPVAEIVNKAANDIEEQFKKELGISKENMERIVKLNFDENFEPYLSVAVKAFHDEDLVNKPPLTEPPKEE